MNPLRALLRPISQAASLVYAPAAIRSRAAFVVLALAASCAAPAWRPQEPPPVAVAASSASRAPVSPPPPDPDPHITSIERGLLRPVRVKGADVRWTLEACMREHGVPGLAVAVIVDYHHEP